MDKLGFFMQLLKNNLDESPSYPVFLVNKQITISSWLGFIISLLSTFIAIFLVRDGILQVFWGKNPTIHENFFLGNEYNATLPLDENFFYSFVLSVYDEESGMPLDESYFTPEVKLIQDGGSSIDLPVIPCVEQYGSYCLDKNKLLDLKLSIVSSKLFTSYLEMNIFPCKDGGNIKCKENSEIDYYLNKAHVFYYFPSNKNQISNILKYREVFRCEQGEAQLSTTIRKRITYFYEYVKITEYDYKNNLFPFFFPLITTEFARIKNIKEDNNNEQSLFKLNMKFDKEASLRMYTPDEYLINYLTNFVEYEVRYKTFSELFAAYKGMKQLLLWLIAFLVNFVFGYFTSNYYNELIFSLFSESKDILSKEPKRKIKLFEKMPKELVKKEDNNIINFIDNNQPFNSKEEKLIYSQEAKLSRCNKFSNGIMNLFLNKVSLMIGIGIIVISFIAYIIGVCKNLNSSLLLASLALLTVTLIIMVIFIIYYATFHSTTYGKNNNMLFNQGKQIIENYCDIVFIMKKLFLVEILNHKKNVINPKLINDFEVNCDDFYEKWIQEQKKPLYKVNDEENEDEEDNKIII